MSFKIGIKTSISSAHRIKNYKGICHNLHGHNYLIFVTVSSSNLNNLNMVMDFKELKEKVNGIIKKLDHVYLNKVLGIDDVTVERIAWNIYKMFEPMLSKTVHLDSVKVYETEDNWAEYGE